MTSPQKPKVGRTLAAVRRDLRALNGGKLPTTAEAEVLQALAEYFDRRPSAITGKTLLDGMAALKAASTPVIADDPLDELSKARTQRRTAGGG